MFKIKSINFETAKDFIDEVFYELDKEIKEMTSELNFNPKHNIIENEKDYVIEISVPGYKKEDIKIQTKKMNLIIKSEKEEKQKLKFLTKGFNNQKFEKIFRLSDDVDKDNIKGKLENGILTITIPKTEESFDKDVEIE